MIAEDILVKAENVSKKFCRDLKRSLWYGVKDLSIFGSGGKRCSQGIVGSLQSIGFTDSDEIEGSIPTRAVAHWSDGFAQAVCSTRRKLERWQISAFAQAEHDSGESLTTGPVTIGTGLAPFQAVWVWDELWVTD